MTSWQKRLRLGLAVFGIALAVVVYLSIRERQPAAAPAPVERLDRKAMLETTASNMLQDRGEEREFEIRAKRTLTYEDGSAKYLEVEIQAPRPDGSIFLITANEATAGPNQVQLQLAGEVELESSDGFRLQTDHATFDQDDGIARVTGEVAFQKGLMSGAGRGASYDQRNDVLRIVERAKVVVKDRSGRTTLDGSAGTATLDRLNDVLFLDSSVHVVRDAQVIDAVNAMARLSVDDDVVTYLELRGGATVQGGASSIESMRASAIDLDYTDDGTSLERVILNGEAMVAVAAGEAASGRRISGDSLDLQLASDGAVTSLSARDRVRLDLPATSLSPGRSVRAGSLDATGEPGIGLNVARFRDDVVFSEEGSEGRPSREARSRALNADLDGDGVRDALFTGGVTFEERDLRAVASEARYQPARNLLSLSGTETGAWPTVSDEQIRVEARSIDVALDGHGIVARENVRTTLRARAPGGTQPRGPEEGRLPGLLRQGEAVSVNAETLDYSGAAGRAVYSGKATLVQGDTAIRGDVITLDRQKGDLVASGAARSALVFDGGRTDGQAEEIRYEDATRVVTYSASRVAPTSVKEPAAEARQAAVPSGRRLAHVSGPNGDLRAGRIEIVLAREGNQVDRLEAYDEVTTIVGARTAAGSRLTYHAREERYVMSGDTGAAPVSIRESCRETTGRTLTFYKSTARIIVDGDESRTETRPCTPERPR